MARTLWNLAEALGRQRNRDKTLKILLHMPMTHNFLLYIWCDSYMDSVLALHWFTKKKFKSGLCENSVAVSFLPAGATTKYYCSFFIIYF